MSGHPGTCRRGCHRRHTEDSGGGNERVKDAITAGCLCDAGRDRASSGDNFDVRGVAEGVSDFLEVC